MPDAAVSFEPAANAAAEFSTANAQSTNASNCFKYLFFIFYFPFRLFFGRPISPKRFYHRKRVLSIGNAQCEMSN